MIMTFNSLKKEFGNMYLDFQYYKNMTVRYAGGHEGLLGHEIDIVLKINNPGVSFFNEEMFSNICFEIERGNFSVVSLEYNKQAVTII